jgi:hypothetical protein
MLCHNANKTGLRITTAMAVLVTMSINFMLLIVIKFWWGKEGFFIFPRAAFGLHRARVLVVLIMHGPKDACHGQQSFVLKNALGLLTAVKTFREHGNELSGFKRDVEFLDPMNYYQLLMNDCAPCSYYCYEIK